MVRWLGGEFMLVLLCKGIQKPIHLHVCSVLSTVGYPQKKVQRTAGVHESVPVGPHHINEQLNCLLSIIHL